MGPGPYGKENRTLKIRLIKPNPNTMAFVLIIHQVASYDLWKISFEQASELRKSAGEICYQLLRYETNANHIVHFSQWTSLENARQFFESDEIKEIRKQAGVQAPEFIYLTELESGAL